MQRDVDDLEPRRPGPEHKRGVGLADHLRARMRAQLILQCDQGRALLRDQQQAGGFLVEPVHEFEELRLRAGAAQLLDHAEGHAAAAMHGHAGGLVDRQQVIVFEHDRELARRRDRVRAALSRILRGAHRRDAHVVADREPGVGARAAFVDANLAAADDAVHMRLRHALQQLDEEVVEPLAFGRFINRDMKHGRRRAGPRRNGLGRGRRRRIGPYNALHHVVAVSV